MRRLDIVGARVEEFFQGVAEEAGEAPPQPGVISH
jgi:hypothetical protein